MKNSLVLAHRGYSGKYLENTMRAFEQAYKVGADGIELDVQLSKDKVPVIYHDWSLERLAGIDQNISDLTFEELQKVQLTKGLDVHSIPSLNEYLGWVQDKQLITNIELKPHSLENHGLERKVLEAVHAFGLADQVIISSFQKESLQRVRKLDSIVDCGYLTPTCSPETLEYAKQLGATFIHPHHTYVTQELIEYAEKFELEINSWTVNSDEDMQRAKDLEIFGIITDFPEKLLELLNETK